MSKLGIKKGLQASAGIPIPAPKKLPQHTPMYPNAWEFPIASLVNVFYTPDKAVKNSNTGEEVPTPVLSFVFVTKDHKQFTHIEFPVDEDDAKFEDKLTALHQRVKHIFEQTIGESRFKEGSMDGDTFAELFENMAKAFNAEILTKGEGEAAKTVKLYTQGYVYIKVVYYKDKLQFPLYPNLVQRAFIGTEQRPCELIINPTYDKTEPQAKVSNNNNNSGGGMYQGGTNHSFGGDFPAFPDMPNV